MLDDHVAPEGRILTVPDMRRDTQYFSAGDGAMVTTAHGWEHPMAGVVPHFAELSGDIPHTGSGRDEHNDEVLSELFGLDDAALGALREAGMAG